MNVTEVGRRHGEPSHRRGALAAAGGLAFVGVVLFAQTVFGSARLEILLAALGCVAGAALVALLTD